MMKIQKKYIWKAGFELATGILLLDQSFIVAITRAFHEVDTTFNKLIIRGVIDKFAEFSSHSFISLSNHLKTCIHVKQLIFTFIIR